MRSTRGTVSAASTLRPMTRLSPVTNLFTYLATRPGQSPELLAAEALAYLLPTLAPDRPGALLILAPSSRFTPLWAELRRRCRLAGLPLHGDHAAGDPIRWTRLGGQQT